MSSRHKRLSNSERKSKGKAGEDLAVSWLVERGHEILERNYRIGRLEVDIITLVDNQLLVFTEVKWRKRDHFGSPEEFASEEQQARIIQAAEEYIHGINWSGDIRFDIISIQSDGEIQHFKDAFY
ncbi:MAG: YraN family protein [Bacteroidota bacterium]